MGPETLHAYWRIPYLEATRANTADGDLFARLPAMGDDRAALIVWRGPLSYLVLNKFPYNAGHLLAVPYREAAVLADLNPAERADLMDAIVKAQDILTRALAPDGFNIGFNFGRAAGMGILRHLHAHIVPRWHGDANFLPVLGDTRVLSVALETMWERLREFAGPES